MPAAGKGEVVIALRGAGDVGDSTLNGPARLVVDLIGARLTAPATLYDGQNRGGVRNIRYAQFRPDTVRVVIDLDALKDYQIQRRGGGGGGGKGEEAAGLAPLGRQPAGPAGGRAGGGAPRPPPPRP